MMKLKKLLLVALLVGCNSTTNEQITEVDINALDLTGNSSKTKDYWRVTKRMNPVYPSNAARDDANGCVEFAFVIGESGKAQNIKIIKSVPRNVFNKSATRALKKFRWKATKKNSLLKPVLTTLQMEFSKTSILSQPVINFLCARKSAHNK
jgi:protein TonB